MSNNILTDEQFGFHDNASSESVIYLLIDSIFNAWNSKEYVMGLLCDLTKAFDSVSYELSISKMEFYGVKGSILNWLKSYLHNRKQRVVLQYLSSPNLLSVWEVFRYGVPQGSMLGSLMFNVYSNDILCIMNKTSHTIFLQTIRIFLFLPVILMN